MTVKQAIDALSLLDPADDIRILIPGPFGMTVAAEVETIEELSVSRHPERNLDMLDEDGVLLVVGIGRLPR